MELAYRKYGSGRPLLILHGLFGQSDNWNTLAKRFADEGFGVYAIDQRNHGLSPHSEAFSYELMAEDLHGFITAHKLSEPLIIGHSMGGKTAMYFALKYKDVVAKLVVADMAPIAYLPHHKEVLKALHAVDFSKISTRREAEEVLSEYIGDFGTMQFLLKNIYWKDTAQNRMAWRFNLEAISESYHEILAPVPEGTCSTPALFMRGGKSNYVTDGAIPEIEKRFPNYTLKTIEGAGHWVHAEKPDAFFEAVLEFIKD